MEQKRVRDHKWVSFCQDLKELERRRCKTDMFYLAKFIIGRHWINPEDKTTPNKLGEDHAALGREVWGYWQSRKERPYKTIFKVEWSRRTLKSTICTGAFPVMALLNNPNLRILIDSETKDKATAFLAPIKQTFEDPYFQYLFGDLVGKNNWTQNEITIKRDGILPQSSITCSGIDADKTSAHFDLVISDDTQVQSNSQTPAMIQAVIENYKLYDNLLDAGGLVLMPCTVWNFNDLAQFIDQMQEQDKKEGRPQRIFVSKRAAYKLKPNGEFDFTKLEFPNILTHEELNFARASQGAFLFSCNYLCRAQSDETATFKREWLVNTYHSKTLFDLQTANIYMAIDPAGEGTYAAADFNAIVVAAITSTFDIFVLHTVNKHLTRQALFEHIIELYDQYHPFKVGIETVFKQHELKAWLKAQAQKNHRPIIWHDFTNKYKTKQHRIQALQPYVEMGKFHLREGMTDLEQQFIRYKPDNGQQEHDDCLDCAAYILDFMAIPANKQPREYWKEPDWKAKLMDEKGQFKDPDFVPPNQATLNHLRWMANRSRRVQGNRPTSSLMHA